MLNKDEEKEWMLKCWDIVQMLMKKESFNKFKKDEDLIKVLKNKFTDKELDYITLQFILKLTNDYVDKLERKDNTGMMFG